jgi:hypothetical protein
MYLPVRFHINDPGSGKRLIWGLDSLDDVGIFK